MRALRLVATVVLAVVVLGLMWYQTFAVTGVITPVASPGVHRPAPPPAPRLTPLPMDQANIELFAGAHPVWSALAN